MRRLVSLLAASILLTTACSSSGGTQQPAPPTGGDLTTAPSQSVYSGGFITPPPKPSTSSDCSFWCGNGSAEVTVGDTTVTLSPGGCADASDNDVDARFGDFTKKGDWIIVLVYHGGTKTPLLSGSIGGKAITMSTSGAAGTIGNDGKGSLSGTELLGTTKISATFSCK